MKYKVIRQVLWDERSFVLEDENGVKENVDIYSSGLLEPPEGLYDEKFSEWLRSFVGKTLEIDSLFPMLYSAGGEKIKVIEESKSPNL